MTPFLPLALLGLMAMPGEMAAAPADTGATAVRAAPVVAAPGGEFPDDDVAHPSVRNPDFLFSAPRTSITLRAGVGLPRAQSDVFDFVFDDFTLDRNDFVAASGALDVGIAIGSHLEALFGIGYGGSSTDSEYRDWVDEDGLPIRQTTRLVRLPITAGLRLYLLPKGRSIGQFAWVPARFAPFLAAGGGVIHYRFEQEGEFVDFRDLVIFEERFTSSGWAPMAQVAAGMDFRVGARTALTVEARQLWASAELDRGFDGFEPIDLTGLQITLGLTWRL